MQVSTVKGVTEELRGELKRAMANPTDLFGIFGFGPEWPVFNRGTGGVQYHEYGVLASLPKVGKSMWLAQIIPPIARQAQAEGKGRTVDVITLETTQKAFLRRMGAVGAHILDPLNIKRGKITREEEERYVAFLDELDRLPIRFLANNKVMSEEEAMMYGMSRIGLKDVRQFVGKDTYWWALDHVGLLSDIAEGDRRIQLVNASNTLQFLAQTVCSGMVVTHLKQDSAGKLPSIQSITETSQLGKDADALYLISRPWFEARDKLDEAERALSKIIEPAVMTYYARDGASDVYTWVWKPQEARFLEATKDEAALLAPILNGSKNSKDKKKK